MGTFSFNLTSTLNTSPNISKLISAIPPCSVAYSTPNFKYFVGILYDFNKSIITCSKACPFD